MSITVRDVYNNPLFFDMVNDLIDGELSKDTLWERANEYLEMERDRCVSDDIKRRKETDLTESGV